MPNDESRQISVRLPPETYAALEKKKRDMEKKAEGVELSFSQVIRSILDDALGVAR